jgi:predicted nucleic acid-binding protein
MYAIINPFDEQDILYLSKKEFRQQVKVSMSTDHELLVLATPGSTRIDNPKTTDPDINPPGDAPSGSSPSKEPSDEEKYSSIEEGPYKDSRRVLRMVSSFAGLMSHEFKEFVTRSDRGVPGILLTGGNLRKVFKIWYVNTVFWALGRAFSSAAPKPHIDYLVTKLQAIHRTQGVRGLVMRLKALSYLVNSASGKIPLTSSFHTGIPIKLCAGSVPADLHPEVRDAIRNRNLPVIKLWSSLLSAYRVFVFDGIPSLRTITDPWVTTADQEFWEDFERYCKTRFCKKFRKVSPSYTPSQNYFQTSAGPNANHNGYAMELDLWVWYKLSEGKVSDSLLGVFLARTASGRKTGTWSSTKGILIYIEATVEKVEEIMSKHDYVVNLEEGTITVTISHPDLWPPEWRTPTLVGPKGHQDYMVTLSLGRVSAIPEPAGKVRIVASVDFVSQFLLQPIHEWMEGTLRRLRSTDCTFDQEGGLKRFVSRNCKSTHSLDLSAATDRLPRKLYQVVFSNSPMGEEVTQAWLNFLSGRKFFVGPSVREAFLAVSASQKQKGERKLSGTVSRRARLKFLESYPDGRPPRFVQYSTGQPMGMLSSWPSMALVHHAVVGYAAYKVNPRSPFFNYTILGDDIVIGDENVANTYLAVMESLGVKISLGKSYRSPDGGLVNFASRTFLHHDDISPVSLREILSIDSLTGAIAFAMRALSRNFVPSPDVKGVSKPLGVNASHWTVSTLLKLSTTPFLWRGYVQRVLRWGVLTTVLKSILCLWFLPGLENPSWTGNQTLQPLTRVLCTKGAAVVSQHHALKTCQPLRGGEEMQDVLLLALLKRTQEKIKTFIEKSEEADASLYERTESISGVLRERFRALFVNQNTKLATALKTIKDALALVMRHLLDEENKLGKGFPVTIRYTSRTLKDFVKHQVVIRDAEGNLDYAEILRLILHVNMLLEVPIDFSRDDFLRKVEQDRETKNPLKTVHEVHKVMVEALEMIGLKASPLITGLDGGWSESQPRLPGRTGNQRKDLTLPEGISGVPQLHSFRDKVARDPILMGTILKAVAGKTTRDALSWLAANRYIISTPVRSP